MAANLAGLNSCDYSFGGIRRIGCFRKHPYTIIEMKTPIQSEIDGGPNGKTIVSTNAVISYISSNCLAYIFQGLVIQ
jgi:hypothetical protein